MLRIGSKVGALVVGGGCEAVNGLVAGGKVSGYGEKMLVGRCVGCGLGGVGDACSVSKVCWSLGGQTEQLAHRPL